MEKAGEENQRYVHGNHLQHPQVNQLLIQLSNQPNSQQNNQVNNQLLIQPRTQPSNQQMIQVSNQRQCQHGCLDFDKRYTCGGFLKANATCSQQYADGSLAVFENQNEAIQAGAKCTRAPCMVGYHDAIGSRSGGFQWVDVFDNQFNSNEFWMPGEPNHSASYAFCALVNSMGQLNDEGCFQKPFVCQYFAHSCL